MLSPRKLEFGRVDLEMKTPSESEVHKVQTPTTPRAQRIAGPTRKLAPSPELVSSPPSAKRREKSSASSDSSFSPCNVVSSSLPSPLRVPSALPSWSERQSMHYPGFDVHQDSFVELLEDRARREVADEDDEDDTKENMPPKRRHKTIILEAPAFAKREGSPSTPRRNEPSKVSSTPRSATPKLSRGAATPSIHLMPPPTFPRHISPEKSEIKDRKRAMEQEVDEAVASDDEDL
ncbi:hypothetical protein SCHPADRAFT_898436 [Schizopora paradoxa]|uniref:Uncharacterized protein n=1 Tax=Schizopora paradoxa TaxID=27342 RepID=A0A0H2SRW2_9AGAM|nr:hypothetical protein SCHPADRAFT_898436 [Schizopora paradoxa]